MPPFPLVSRRLPRIAAALILLAGCGEPDTLGPRQPNDLDPISTGEFPFAAAVAPTNFWATKAPLPFQRSHGPVGVLNGNIYVIGGLSPVGFLRSVDAYNPVTDTWASKAPMPVTIDRPNGAATINGILYVPGGMDFSQPKNTLYAYSASTNTWTNREPMPVAGGCGTSGVIAGKLYVHVAQCGGAGQAFLRYDPATNRWISLPAPTIGHRYGAAAVVGNKFYLAGGMHFDGSTGLTSLEVFDPATNTWSRRRGPPFNRYMAAGAAAGGLFYVIGGYEDGAIPSRVVTTYDPGSDTWSSRPELPSARVDLSAATVGGRVYALGGEVSGRLSNLNEVYTPGDLWVTKTPLLTPRGDLVAALVGGQLYAVGGHNGAPSNANQSYAPATDRWTARANLPQPRFHANGAGVINGVAYVPGGVADNAMVRTLYAYTASTNTWTTKTPMPVAGGRGASGVIGGKLFVLSGANAGFCPPGGSIATIRSRTPGRCAPLRLSSMTSRLPA